MNDSYCGLGPVLYCPWCRHAEDGHDYSAGTALVVGCPECPDGVCDITESARRAVARMKGEEQGQGS